MTVGNGELWAMMLMILVRWIRRITLRDPCLKFDGFWGDQQNKVLNVVSDRTPLLEDG